MRRFMPPENVLSLRLDTEVLRQVAQYTFDPFATLLSIHVVVTNPFVMVNVTLLRA